MRMSSHYRFVGPLAASVLFVSACGSGAPKGNAERGKGLYAQCAGCHELGKNSVGPMHCHVLGRASGSVANYEYSEAMKTSGLVWDEKTLDEFLTAPFAYVTGTKMGFAGFANPTDRADVIAYLREAGSDSSACPPSN
jgi:cytochrome c